MRKYRLADIAPNNDRKSSIEDQDASNSEELEALNLYDKDFEDFLDTLSNSNQVEMLVRDDNNY